MVENRLTGKLAEADYEHIDRLTMMGKEKLRLGMATFGRPFIKATTQQI